MKYIKTKLLSKIRNKEEIDKSSIVYFSKDNFRSFDTNTGFQTNHISNRNSGDWDKSFSSKEIEILDFEFKDSAYIRVVCHDWSDKLTKKNGWIDEFKVYLTSKELNFFINNVNYE